MGVAADLIVQARRSAGLSQRALAVRAGCAHVQIVRWETARHEPSVSTLQQVLRACDAELPITLARADTSDDRLIVRQLARTPSERVAECGVDGFDPLGLCRLLASADVPFVACGAVAAAFYGSPLLLGHRTLSVVADPAQLPAIAATLSSDPDVDDSGGPEHVRVRLTTRDGVVEVAPRPAGTDGYRDLRRHAIEWPDTGGSVLIADIVDVLRICDASVWTLDRALVPTLRRIRELGNVHERPAAAA